MYEPDAESCKFGHVVYTPRRSTLLDVNPSLV